MSISTLNSGENTAINVVPDYAKATVCCRFTEEHTKESLKSIIKNAIKHNSDVSCLLIGCWLDFGCCVYLLGFG